METNGMKKFNQIGKKGWKKRDVFHHCRTKEEKN
jgi:hypothetical protein